MAKTLAQRRIPMILSVWVPPDWAVDHSRKIPKGVKLDEQKLQKIADSVADYLVFLKKNYGVEIALFLHRAVEISAFTLQGQPAGIGSGHVRQQAAHAAPPCVQRGEKGRATL